MQIQHWLQFVKQTPINKTQNYHFPTELSNLKLHSTGIHAPKSANHLSISFPTSRASRATATTTNVWCTARALAPLPPILSLLFLSTFLNFGAPSHSLLFIRNFLTSSTSVGISLHPAPGGRRRMCADGRMCDVCGLGMARQGSRV